MKDFIDALKLMVYLLSYVALGVISYMAGSHMGIQKGRAQFHDELIQEFDARGDAQILLYKPNTPK